MSGQNYIGSKISLISLSDIRYVGILHNINPMESTVALQNVKSYGTEGRKGNLNEEILASDNVFDYVVFRGSDIKDLQVFEAPPSFQSEFSNSSSSQQRDAMTNTAPYASSYYSTQQQAYSNVNYRAPYGSNVMNQSNGYWQNATNTITGTTATATGPTPASVFSNQAQQQQQFFYHHHHHQQPQQPRFQMPVPENYQVVPSSNAASSAVESTTTTTTSFNQTLPGNYTVDTLSNKTSPKKQDEKQDKTVAPIFSEKEAVSAVIVSKTGMQASTSQEKEEVAVIEQVDEVLVDSLVKQVSDLDIKQPVQESCSKSTSRNIKEKQAIRKQQDSSRQKTIVKEGNGRKSDGGKQPSKHNSTSRAITTNNNSNVSEAISQTETKSSREGDAQRTRELNSQRNSNNGGARRNSSNNRNNNGGIVIPKVDFDFASSNAKFDKTIIAKDDALDNENETVTIPEADHFYDKKKSFFDDISCESKEYQKRSNRTGTYKEESKLNLETFGQANPTGQNRKRHQHRNSRGRGRPQQRNGRNKPVFNQSTQLESS